MNTDAMWEQLCSYNQMNFKNLNCDEDEYYGGVKKSLFYTLSFLIKDDNCLNECTYWFKLVRLTKEYSSECAERKFERFVNSSGNEKVMKFYNDFSVIKKGYSGFFQELNIEISSLVLDKFGLKAYLEECKNDNKRVL